FDGIDTTLPGLFSALGRPEPTGARALLTAIDAEVQAAAKAFSMQNPSASVPALARGLAATRMAIERLSAERDAVFTLRVKEQQFQDAINTALGIELQAIAGVPGPAVPGQRISVETSLTNHGSIGIDDITFELVAPPQSQPVGAVAEHLGANETV